jgi:hypothetical protein
MKMAKMKERIKAKAEANAKAKEQADTAFCNVNDSVQTTQTVSEEELLKIFSAGEKPEKTPRGAKPPSQSGKKKGKNKKNK